MGRLTIDEALSKYKEITNTDAICPAHCNISCDKCVQESDQIAEWLEELKVYQQHEIICNKGYNAGYNKAIDDFVKALCIEYATVSDEMQNEYDNVCSRFEKIAEQLKAGGTE